MVAQMLQRRGLASEWSSVNPILADGEIGIDKTNKALKIGDGITHWNDLKFSYILKSQLQAKGDLLVGTGLNAGARLPAGTPGQTLSIDASGSLVWIDKNNPSSYVEAGYADATYETQAEAAAAHGAMITSAAMNSTYETLSASNATHALFETFTHASATFAPKASADTAYRKKWSTYLKTATSTIINSTYLGYISDMQFSVEKSSSYIFEVVVFYAATVAGGMRVIMEAPIGTSLNYNIHAPTTAIGSGGQFAPSFLQLVKPANSSDNTGFIDIGAAGATTPLFLTIKGRLTTGPDYAGTCQFIHAQTVATNDTGAQVFAPSYIRGRKVG